MMIYNNFFSSGFHARLPIQTPFDFMEMNFLLPLPILSRKNYDRRHNYIFVTLQLVALYNRFEHAKKPLGILQITHVSVLENRAFNVSNSLPGVHIIHWYISTSDSSHMMYICFGFHALMLRYCFNQASFVKKIFLVIKFDKNFALLLFHSRSWSPLVMTSSNGNIFRVTGHLCGEFTSHRWIPRTKASDAELWCFLWSASD